MRARALQLLSLPGAPTSPGRAGGVRGPFQRRSRLAHVGSRGFWGPGRAPPLPPATPFPSWKGKPPPGRARCSLGGRWGRAQGAQGGPGPSSRSWDPRWGLSKGRGVEAGGVQPGRRPSPARLPAPLSSAYPASPLLAPRDSRGQGGVSPRRAAGPRFLGGLPAPDSRAEGCWERGGVEGGRIVGMGVGVCRVVLATLWLGAAQVGRALEANQSPGQERAGLGEHSAKSRERKKIPRKPGWRGGGVEGRRGGGSPRASCLRRQHFPQPGWKEASSRLAACKALISFFFPSSPEFTPGHRVWETRGASA